MHDAAGTVQEAPVHRLHARPGTCLCGSQAFRVTFRTDAAVSVVRGVPVAVTYGSPDTAEFFSSATCEACGRTLDGLGRVTEDGPESPVGGYPDLAPADEAVRPPLLAARAVAEAWTRSLPDITVGRAAPRR